MSHRYSGAPSGWAILGTVCGLITVGLTAFWILFLNYVNPNEMGVAYNMRTGQLHVQEKPGWHLSGLFTQATVIRTGPRQLCLRAGTRIVGCRMVQFVPEHIDAFVKLHGFHYWNDGQTGMSCGAAYECGEFAKILLGYAFVKPLPPFLEEAKNDHPTIP